MLNTVVDHVLRTVGEFAVAAMLVVAPSAVQARGTLPQEQPTTVALAELSSQARTTYRLILKGGPFPYDKDGTVFGNRER